jgi:hypothetical protein
MNTEENRPIKERIMKSVKYSRTSNRFHCSLKDRLRLLKHSETEHIHMSALGGLKDYAQEARVQGLNVHVHCAIPPPPPHL